MDAYSYSECISTHAESPVTFGLFIYQYRKGGAGRKILLATPEIGMKVGFLGNFPTCAPQI